MESISSRVRKSPRSASVQCVKRMREMAADAYDFDGKVREFVSTMTPNTVVYEIDMRSEKPASLRVEVSDSGRKVYALRSRG